MYPRMIQVEAELSHLLDADYSEEFSCIAHQLDEQQDVHDKFQWSDKYVKENTPINKVVTVSDVATSITFLASEAASMITGSSIIIDGGWTAK